MKLSPDENKSSSSDEKVETAKKPNPIDVHVGSRVRLRRMLLGFSQERLGEQLGLTFQQVQKYEKGVNRIGASRLFQLSKILDVPIQFFFDDQPTGDSVVEQHGFAEEADGGAVFEFLNTREGLELNRAFAKITDSQVRRKVIDLVKSISEGGVKTE